MKKLLKDPIKVTLLMEREDEQFFRSLMPETEKFFSGFMARFLHQLRQLMMEGESVEQK